MLAAESVCGLAVRRRVNRQAPRVRTL